MSEFWPWRETALQLLPEPLAAQLAVERAGAAFVEAAVERLDEIGEGGAGDVGQVEVQRLVERRPDELDQFGLGMDGALDAPGDRKLASAMRKRASKRRGRPGGVIARARKSMASSAG